MDTNEASAAALYQQRREQLDVSLNIVDVQRRCYDDDPISSYNDDDSRMSSSIETDFRKSSSFDDDKAQHLTEKVRNISPLEQPLDQHYTEGESLQGGEYPDYEAGPPIHRETPADSAHLQPIKHFPMLILANLFFLIGSAAFTWLSWNEEYKAGKHQITGENEIKFEIPIQGGNDEEVSQLQQSEETEATTSLPDGYHLKLSTSLDTWITQEMILALAATFCFLQAAIVNLVRTWRFYHLCQMVAGLTGLVSAMFWETKLLLSDIFYFLAMHAMLIQAILSLHMRYLNYIQPFLDDRKRQIKERNNAVARRTSSPTRNQSRYFSPRRRRNVESHFVFDSSRDLSQNPSGLYSPSDDENDKEEYSYSEVEGHRAGSDGNCFSIENSYSYDENGPPPSSPAVTSSNPTQGPDEYYETTKSGKQIAPITSHTSTTAARSISNTRFRFGLVFCIADSLFVIGSILEVTLTYLVVFVLADDAAKTLSDNEGEQAMSPTEGSYSAWENLASGLRVVPGIMWGLRSIVVIVAAFAFQLVATSIARSSK